MRAHARLRSYEAKGSIARKKAPAGIPPGLQLNEFTPRGANSLPQNSYSTPNVYFLP